MDKTFSMLRPETQDPQKTKRYSPPQWHQLVDLPQTQLMLQQPLLNLNHLQLMHPHQVMIFFTPRPDPLMMTTKTEFSPRPQMPLELITMKLQMVSITIFMKSRRLSFLQKTHQFINLLLMIYFTPRLETLVTMMKKENSPSQWRLQDNLTTPTMTILSTEIMRLFPMKTELALTMIHTTMVITRRISITTIHTMQPLMPMESMTIFMNTTKRSLESLLMERPSLN